MTIQELYRKAAEAATPAEAIALYEQLLCADPQNSQVYNNLGELYGSQGRADKALVYFLKAVELSPLSGVYYSNLALAFQCLGEVEEAIANYSKSIALQPSWTAYNNRAGLYNSRREYDKALADIAAALKLKGQEGGPWGKAHLYATRAEALMGQERWREALEAVNAGQAFGPADELVGFYDKALLRCHLKLGISLCAGKGCH